VGGGAGSGRLAPDGPGADEDCVRLTWSLTPHSPAGRLADRAEAAGALPRP